ncbi:GNAT family N-acetyltransferase [Halobellus sp. Atlit-31R]|nr:GNAT family N-acetyltransferase [Halobellus sp. Atlit-31R]
MLEAAQPWLLRILGLNCVGLLVPGIGRLLMRCLLDYCRARGVPLVEDLALPENTRMHALAGSLGFAVQAGDDGMVNMRLGLPRTV